MRFLPPRRNPLGLAPPLRIRCSTTLCDGALRAPPSIWRNRLRDFDRQSDISFFVGDYGGGAELGNAPEKVQSGPSPPSEQSDRPTRQSEYPEMFVRAPRSAGVFMLEAERKRRSGKSGAHFRRRRHGKGKRLIYGGI